MEHGTQREQAQEQGNRLGELHEHASGSHSDQFTAVLPRHILLIGKQEASKNRFGREHIESSNIFFSFSAQKIHVKNWDRLTI